MREETIKTIKSGWKKLNCTNTIENNATATGTTNED